MIPEKIYVSKVSVAKLTISNEYYNLHEIYVDEHYVEDAKYFNQYDLPFVTKDKIVLSNIQEVQAALNADEPFIWVRIIDFDEKDLVRFVAHKNYFTKSDHKSKFRRLRYLKAHLKENKYGIIWAAELPGDMDRKLSIITGISESSIKLIMKIGLKNEQGFEKISAGHSSLREEYNKIIALEKGESSEIEPAIEMQLNADFALPFSFSLSNNLISINGRELSDFRLSPSSQIRETNSVIIFDSCERKNRIEIRVSNINQLTTI